MRRVFPILLLAVLLVSAWGASRRGSTGSRPYSSKHAVTSPKTHKPSRPATRPYSSRVPKSKCYNCPRDSQGRIKRSDSARRQFERQHPCPATGKTSGPCPGYQIDHRQALKDGGADAPSNMQWLTDSQHRAKHAGK